MKILIASRNKHKIEEIRAIFRGMELVSADEVPGLPDVIEDGATLEDNARKKAVTLAMLSGLWALADDTGLEVAALGGAPGVFSARYAGENVSYADNNRKLLEELTGIKDRRACFRSVIAVSDTMGRVKTVEGRCEGRIDTTAAGNGGFGYDPLFYPDGHDRSFAEMSSDEKNRISHRARSLQAAASAWGAFLGTSPLGWAAGG